MNNVNPVMRAALEPFAPRVSTEGVECKQIRHGRISEWEFRGLNRDAVHRAAERRMSAIDPYRSPAVVAQMKDQGSGEYVEIVRYYAFD